MDHHWIIIIIIASAISIKWCYLSILLVRGSSTEPTLCHVGCRPSLHVGLHLLRHLNPPSLDINLTSKGKLGKNTNCSKGQRDVDSSIRSGNNGLKFSCSSIPLLQCIQRVPYIVLQWGNGRSNPSDLKAYGRPRDKRIGSTSRKTPKLFGLLHTSRCMQGWSYLHI